MDIYRDTVARGTPARPQYFMFLRYGTQPAREFWLDATEEEAARHEAARRFGDCYLQYKIVGDTDRRAPQ